MKQIDINEINYKINAYYREINSLKITITEHEMEREIKILLFELDNLAKLLNNFYNIEELNQKELGIIARRLAKISREQLENHDFLIDDVTSLEDIENGINEKLRSLDSDDPEFEIYRNKQKEFTSFKYKNFDISEEKILAKLQEFNCSRTNFGYSRYKVLIEDMLNRKLFLIKFNLEKLEKTLEEKESIEKKKKITKTLSDKAITTLLITVLTTSIIGISSIIFSKENNSAHSSSNTTISKYPEGFTPFMERTDFSYPNCLDLYIYYSQKYDISLKESINVVDEVITYFLDNNLDEVTKEELDQAITQKILNNESTLSLKKA